MTALQPIENVTHVRGVASKRYPPNTVCAHPECDKPVESIHHIFGRVPPETDSWFVEINSLSADAIPHAIGLCGSGTTGHHGDLEEHRAWIKLEDGEFVWYERKSNEDDPEAPWVGNAAWRRLGPLNPQPGSREGKPKRKRFKGEEKRQRTTKSIRVPDDAREHGTVLLEEAIEQLEERISPGKHRPPYHTLMDALNYALLNSGPEDFVG